jgi:hypothetical protein
MSYDLMVFNKSAAPKNRKEFMEWYDFQTEWSENHDYNDPKNTTNELKNWYLEMIETFPDLNGAYNIENSTEEINESDYSIGNNVIYVAFAWSLAENAYNTMYNLAEKHGVGFFDVSSDNGNIYFPENGKLKLINFDINEIKYSNKPWWKFW